MRLGPQPQPGHEEPFGEARKRLDDFDNRSKSQSSNVMHIDLSGRAPADQVFPG